jgi:hypothetical protein
VPLEIDTVAAAPHVRAMVGPFLILVALAAADPPAQAPRPRLVCRGSSASLGSHIRTPRRCLTEEQWRQEDEEHARLPLSMQVTEGQNDGHAASAPH